MGITQNLRVFLYEYTCAIGQSGPLHAEGQAMLQAVVEDFGRIPDVHTMTLRGDTSPKQVATEEETFRQLAHDADFTLVIAPEFDDILARRCRWILDAGGRLLGPGPEAVTLAADKLLLAGRLRQNSVPSPSTILIEESTSRFVCFPAVCKPRFGAGSQATFLVREAKQLEDVLALASKEMPGADFILQSFVPGVPASVAFLIGPNAVLPLLPAAQHLSNDGRFRYQGGEIPLPTSLAERALGLAGRAVAAIPGLLGYIGVDLVLGVAVDGSEDYVIEINPRLTTSYIGLRQLARNNLAKVWLDLLTGKVPVPLAWRSDKVRFRADGSLLI